MAYTAEWQTGNFNSTGGYEVAWRVLDENGDQLQVNGEGVTISHTFTMPADAFVVGAGQALVDAQYNTSAGAVAEDGTII